MRKWILLMLVAFSFSLASAQNEPWYYCGSPISPFQNCQVLQNFTDVTAGSLTCSKIYFDNKAILKLPLIVRINYTAPEGYEIWRGDFSGFGWVYSETGGYNKSLICEQPEIKTFFGEEYEVPNNTLYCYNPEDLFIVKEKSDNVVTICLRPHIALVPTTFNFTEELLSVLGPIWAEPQNITENGCASIPLANLEIFTNFSEPILINAILYSDVFIKKVPENRPFAVQFIDITTNATEEQLAKGIKIRIYYDEDYLRSRGLDEGNLGIYRFSVDDNRWIEILTEVNQEENYVESIWLNKLSLFGLFASPKPIVQTIYVNQTINRTVYIPSGPTTIIYNVTNATNVTKEVLVEKKPVCGNEICEATENCENCPQDCSCPQGSECKQGTCVFTIAPICGNGICEVGEGYQNCPSDCPAPKYPSPICGNKVCEANENCGNCPEDCGCPSGYECQNGVCVLTPTGAAITGFAVLPTPYTIGLDIFIILILLIVIVLLSLWAKKKWIFRK